MFGDYDNNYIKTSNPLNPDDDILWYPLVGKTWWQISIADINYGKTSIFTGKTKTCIMDTGTSLIAMPNDEFTDIAKRWQKDAHEVICSTEICYA